MGIPVLFDYQRYGDMILVDGEILANQVLVTESLANSAPVIVFQVGSQQRATAPASKDRFRVSDYFVQLADAFVLALSSKRLNPWAWQHTILIDTGPIPPIKFNLSRAEKKTLIDCGYATTLEILPIKLGRPTTPFAREAPGAPDGTLRAAAEQLASQASLGGQDVSATRATPVPDSAPRSPTGR